MAYKIAIFALVALHALTASALPPCVCTRNLQPVCGSDGQTYSNNCLLECEKHKTGKDITMKREGPCDGVQQPVCICTYEYKPVCGTDGTTYPNKCALKCERSLKPNIEVASEGACDAVKVAQPPCTCPDVLKPVCGSDGNTYDNDCILNCETARNPSLSIKSYSKCDDKIKVVDIASLPSQPLTPPCICTEELDRVCGSDGTTYANPCLLNCATAQNPSLSVKHQGKCESVNVASPVQGDQPSTCACPRNLKPVCGSDGVTYNNECLLRCAGSQVSLARNAPCGY